MKTKDKEFVLRLDINDGFAIRECKPAEYEAENPQELLNGADGGNLEHGRADYHAGVGQIEDIINLLSDSIRPARDEKVFLVVANISDGGYEHYSYGIVTDHKTVESATKFAEEVKNEYFGWADREDEVTVTIERVSEIDPIIARICANTGVVGYVQDMREE